MPAKEIVPVSILGGVDTNTSEFTTERFQIVDNLRYRKRGGLEPRYGTTKMYGHDVTATGDTATAGTVEHMFDYGGSSMRVGNRKLFSQLSSGAFSRRLQDTLSPVTATYDGLTAGTLSFERPDSASVNGFFATAYTNTNDVGFVGTLFLTVTNGLGGPTIIDRLVVDTFVSNYRLLVVQNWIVLVYTPVPDIGSPSVRMRLIDTASLPLTLSSATTLVSAKLSDDGITIPFDAAAYLNTSLDSFLLAVVSSSPSLAITTHRVALDAFGVPTVTALASSTISESGADVKNIAVATPPTSTWGIVAYSLRWTSPPVSYRAIRVFQAFLFGATKIGPVDVESGLSSEGADELGVTVVTDTLTSAIGTYALVWRSIGGYLKRSLLTDSTGSALSVGSIIRSTNADYGMRSRPFVVDGRVYVLVFKGTPIVNVQTDSGGYCMLVDVDIASTGPVIPVCNVLPRQVTFYGMDSTTCSILASPVRLSATEYMISAVIGVDSSVQSDGKVITIRFDWDSVRSSAFANGVQTISGGIPSAYDGTQVYEHGYFARPTLSAYSSPGATSFATGTYYYKAVFEWVDNTGAKCSSEPSTQVELPLDPTLVSNLTVSTLDLTRKQRSTYDNGSQVIVSIYRTVADQSVFFKVFSQPVPEELLNDFSVNTLTYVDELADADLVNNEPLYVSGEDPNVVLGNESPPSATVVVTHNNRLWLAGTPDDTIWYSKPFVLGTGIGFSVLLIYPAFENGRITSLASLDAYLVIFKRRATYMLQGDGNDNTGLNSTLVAPIRLSGDIGCIDHRATIVVSDTVYWQAERGLYAMKRGSNEMVWVGEPVAQYTSEAGSSITSAVHVPDANEIRWTWVSADDTTSKTLVFNLRDGTWSTFSYNDLVDLDDTVPVLSGASAACMVGSDYWFASTVGNEYREDKTTYLDCGAQWVTWTFRTGWLHLGAIQGYQRVGRLRVLGQYHSSFKLNATLQFDYNPSTQEFYTKSTATSVVGSAPVQFEYGIARQKSQSIRITLTNDPPEDPEEVLTGQCMSLENVSLFATKLRFGQPLKNTAR